jgi:hypothetical protein
MYCTNCGTPNKNSARFCINCAQSLIEVQIERRLSRPRSRRVESLFSFSFSRFVSPRMMKFLYILSILFAGFLDAFLIIAAFKTSIWVGIFAVLIGSPLIFLLTMISSRVVLETILMIFRIADQMANIGVANIALPTTEEKPESRDSIQWNI